MLSTKALLIRVVAGTALTLALLFAAGWWFLKVCTFQLINQSAHTLADVRFDLPLNERAAGGFVRELGTLQPGERRWVFVVPPVYGAGTFSFRAAGRTHRIDAGEATHAMGVVWTIRVDPKLRTTPEVKFSVL